MVLIATLLTDVPLDAAAFRGVLLDCSQSALAGAITVEDLRAVHSFGEADRDTAPRDIEVRCRSANTAPRAALVELRKNGFEARTALEFHTPGDPESEEDAWALLRLYADELRGWALTRHFDHDTAAEILGSAEGLLHVPLGGPRRSVLIAASALALLA